MSIKILISTSSFAGDSREPLSLLDAAGVEYRLNPYGRKLKPAESIELLADVDGVIAGVELLDRNVLCQAARLKVISRCGTGMDSVDLAAAAELGIRVYNTPDAHVDAVAELTLAGILNLLREVGRADRLIRQGTWQKPMGRLLRGKWVGLIGLGRVGRALVGLLRPFHVTILAYDPYPDEQFAHENHIRYCELPELLAGADIVSLHLPYSAANHHLLNRSNLERLKPGALLVNCARGGLIDEDALADRLRDGRIAGAYLDTFEQEPYQGPLAELDNVLLSPHIGSYATECRVRMEMEAVRNLLAGMGK
jgi:D-3-phosphoglycerate dehydrogenase / 2-oxoglutarate reductase